MSSSSSSKIENKKLIPFPKTAQNTLSKRSPPSFSEIINSSKLVTTPVSPIKIVSPFSKSSNSKFPSSSSKSIPLNSQKSAYLANPNYQRIQILEDYQITKLSQGFHLLSDHLFGPGKTFQHEPYKTREYYQTILECSGSVKFEHKSNSVKGGSIDYSKAHIFKILSPEDWGINPYSEKVLVGYNSYPRFTYYDYQEAWFKAFLIRNFSHSWFIFFDLNIDYNYPRWFVNWYKFMGLIPNCLPKEVSRGFEKFKQLFIQEIPEFEYLLQFSILFKIPWIFTWTYNYQEASGISPPWLNRQYRVKWWDKFKIDQANERSVVKYYQEMKFQEEERQEDSIKNYNDSDTDLVERIIGAAKSSPENIQKLIQEIRSSTSGSEGSPSTSLKNEVFQDAQDPFDDPYEN